MLNDHHRGCGGCVRRPALLVLSLFLVSCTRSFDYKRPDSPHFCELKLPALQADRDTTGDTMSVRTIPNNADEFLIGYVRASEHRLGTRPPYLVGKRFGKCYVEVGRRDQWEKAQDRSGCEQDMGINGEVCSASVQSDTILLDGGVVTMPYAYNIYRQSADRNSVSVLSIFLDTNQFQLSVEDLVRKRTTVSVAGYGPGAHVLWSGGPDRPYDEFFQPVNDRYTLLLTAFTEGGSVKTFTRAILLDREPGTGEVAFPSGSPAVGVAPSAIR